MQQNSLVSIICLCYNHEMFVMQSLNSVIQQNYPHIELIIVDDCSTDNSKTVIASFLEQNPGVCFVANSQNLGNTKSFNKALSLAKGDYIIDLAADDILLENCVTLQIEAFKKSSYKNLALVYGNMELIKEDGAFDSYYFPVNPEGKVVQKRPSGDIYHEVLRGGQIICSPSAMIKKTALDSLQGFDESLAYEDLNFWIRASRLYDFDFIDEIIVQKRISQHSLGSHFYQRKDSRARKINHSTFLILKKAISLNKTKKEHLAILKRIHFELVLAYKTADYILLFKYIVLELRQRIRILFAHP